MKAAKTPRRSPAPDSSAQPKKDPLDTRRYLWQVIRSWTATGSMPCWALPFESIAAALLLKDRSRKRKKTEAED